MEKLKLVKKILLIILAVFIFILAILIIYNRVTINNEYSLGEKNLNIPIFVYHNIVNDKSEIEYDYMQTDKETFENQITGLKKYGYDFITYDKLYKYKNNEIKIRKNSCILTFDDGFRGVYDNVYPIAKKYNIPFTIFLIINDIGKDNYLNWEQVKEMKNSGLVTIGTHSMNHDDFFYLTDIDAVNDVNDSYKIIEKNIGEQNLKIFTYPYGRYKDEQINELEKQGYIQNLTDNKINKSSELDLSRLHRCYPLSDSTFKILVKILYRSIKY